MKFRIVPYILLGALLLSPTSMSPLLAQETISQPDSVDMVVIPAGPFIRGSREGEGRSDEFPRRKIHLKAFAIDKYEVSNARYLKFVKDTNHKPPFNVYGEGPLADVQGIGNLPVVQVTWHDAVDYCFWAGKRLPTEAEWEKAARGTDGRLYPWGDKPDNGKFANYDREWEDKTTLMEVSSLPEGRSPYGIYHLAGNVREWVHDWYDRDYYSTSPDKNPQGPDNGILKVLRGGSWHSFLSDLRNASRGKGGFALKTHGVGFRCAMDVSASQKLKSDMPNEE